MKVARADLPERGRREVLAPPPPPALDGAAVDADELREPSHPRGRRALPHDRDQHHDRGEIDLAAEEAQRRRRLALAATVARAAEAEAPVVLLARAGTAGRAACGGYRAECSAPPHSAHRPRRAAIGEVPIKDEKQLMECGVGQQGLIQRMRPPRLKVVDHDGQTRTQ